MVSELSEFNERRRGSNKVPIEEDKWKELSSKSSEELEQGIHVHVRTLQYYSKVKHCTGKILFINFFKVDLIN